MLDRKPLWFPIFFFAKTIVKIRQTSLICYNNIQNYKTNEVNHMLDTTAKKIRVGVIGVLAVGAVCAVLFL